MDPAYGLSLQTLCALCKVWPRQAAVTLSLIQQIYNKRHTIRQTKHCALEAAPTHSVQSVKYLHTKFAK